MGMRIVGRDVPEIGEILDSYGFRTMESAGFGDARSELLKSMSCDKKRTGDSVTLVVPAAIGDCRLVPVPIAELGKWL